MRLLFTVLFGCILSLSALGQAAGDYRSVLIGGPGGNWNSIASWETFNGSTWVAATDVPVSTLDGVITIQSGHTINMTAGELIDQVVVVGTLKINAGVNATFNNINVDAITVSAGGVLDVSGTLTFQTNARLRVQGSVGNPGTVIGEQGATFSGATATNCLFEANSVYNHAYSTAVGTIPVANWNATSTLLVTGTSITPTTAPANFNQNFGNVTINLISGTGSLGLAGALTSIQGNFSTLSTNARPVTFATAANYSLTINGDMNLAGGGAINFNTATTGTSTLTIVGSFSHTQNTFTLAGPSGTSATNVLVAHNFTRTANGSITRGGATGGARITFNGTTQTYFNSASTAFSNVNFTVNNGSTVDFGSSPLNGGGTFTLNLGGTIVVGSTDPGGAISTTGNIRVTGAKTFSSGSTVIYRNATNSPQFMGSAHPTNAGVTTIIDNTGGVTLTAGSLVLNGNLTLTNGNFDISSRDLTLGGVFTPNSNFLVGDVATILRISDSGTTAPFPSLRVSGTSLIGSLIIEGTTGRTVGLGADISISNELTLDNGDLQLNGFTLDIAGTITQNAGTLTASATSGLTISDSGLGTLPADLLISGGALGTLTMNRLGADLATSSNLDITTLNLVNGSVTHSGTITMTDGGKINVDAGILTNPVAAANVYDVEYNGASATDTHAELPTSGTTLRDLIITNPAQVNLQAAAVVNRNLILSTGTFASNGVTLTLRGNFQSDAASDFTTGTIIFDGTTTITGSTSPQLGNVTINPTMSLTLDPALPINVAGDFDDDGTFTAGTGTVSFNGTAEQFLTGASTTSFYDFEVNKSSNGVTIQHPVQVVDDLRILTASAITAGTNQLTIVSNASNTGRVNPLPVGAAINGSVIVQRFLPNASSTKEYRYLSSPVTNTSVADWQQEIPVTGSFSDPSSGGTLIPTEVSMFLYDETFTAGGPTLEDRYVGYPSSGTAASNPLEVGRGYAVYTYAAGTTTVDSRGTLGQGSYPIGVTAQSAGGNDGWNLIGNPYPSPILWDNLTRSGSVDNAVYITDNTNINGGGPTFITYAGGIGSPAGYGGEIATGQGFWVHATANGTVTFDEDDKIVDTDAQVYRSAPRSEVLRVTVTGSERHDETVISFLDEATNDFDEYDALKMKGVSLNLSSILSDGRSMVINTLEGMNCTQQIPLSITEVEAGDYTFSAIGFDSFTGDVDIKLIDNKTSITTDLRTASYDFTITAQEAGAVNGRFVIETGKTRVFADLPVTDASICFTDLNTSVSIANTQPEIDYQVFFGETALSSVVRGNSGTLNIEFPAKTLETGENTLSIVAKNGCTTKTLADKAIVSKMALTSTPVVTNALACATDQAVLTATGALQGQSYNWYSSIDATEPLATTSEGSYDVSGLTGTTSYYVAIANSSGCASEKVAAEVKVVDYEPVAIDVNGTILTSSYFTGNQWYRDGNLLQGQNGPSLNVTESGNYTVKVNIQGCSTEASIVQEITGLEDAASNISIYPNPIVNQINIQFPAGTGASGVSIVNTSGKIVYTGSLNASGSLTIDTTDIAAGIYIVRIEIDGQIVSKKIIKI